MPVRIQRRRTKGWKMPEGAVSVDRTTIFGNPFKIVGPFTSLSTADKGKKIWMVENAAGAWFFDTKIQAQEFAVTSFRAWINHPPQERLRSMGKLHLKGKDLACWCRESDPCHATVWLEIVNPGESEHA